MTSTEIRQIIIEELLEGGIGNLHGISLSNIHQYLIEPVLINYVKASDGEIKKFWVVFDEQPDDKEQGYQIVFDPREQEFGIATRTSVQSKKLGCVLGLYGAFLDAVNSM
jgi:hypothetical protein